MLFAEALEDRLARSHRSVLAGLQRRLVLAEEKLAAKESHPETHHSDLKRERLYVEQLRRAEGRMRDVVARSGYPPPEPLVRQGGPAPTRL